MADTASLYSTTDTLVDVDVDVSVLGRNTYLPGDVGPIHVSLFTVYDRAPPSADRLTSGEYQREEAHMRLKLIRCLFVL